MVDRLKQVMADVFSVPMEDLQDDVAINEVTRWDSLRHVELMLALEMNFGLHLTVYEMLEMISYEAIEQYLQDRGIRVIE